MALNAKKAPKGNNTNRVEQEAIHAGTYPCRVVQILDMGVQEQRPYQGEAKPPAHELMMTYEFLDEFCKDENGEELEDKPRWLSETFPLRHIEQDLAKSTKRYKALDPQDVHDGDFTALINSTCDVAVVQNAGKGKNAGKVYNNISGINPMRPRDAAKAPELVNPPKVFVLDEPDMEVFKSLPDWLQDKIKGNLDYEGSELQRLVGGGVQEDEPKEQPKKKVVEEEEGSDEPW